jgi:general secretion pathway protein K|nr:type II secretion system minor pseudopilin GspK [Bradyrhizobium sp.]
MIGTPNRRAAKLSEHGFVLVAVLWILAALSALAVVFAVYLSNSAQALAINDTAIEAEGVISAGVELTAYQLLLAKDDERPSRGSFHTRLNGADLAVSYVSEAARVDLNAASKELLTGLLSTLGADGDKASNYADRIVGWRTAPASGAAGNPPSDAAGNEDALYRAAGLPYSPRQAPFAHASELALVLDLPPALVERALPLVTVYSGSSGVDVLIAEPDVIAALPGMTPLVLKDFLNTRATLPNDPAAIAEALGPAQAGAAKQKSKAYRLLVRVKLRNGRERVSEVVISVSGPNQQSQQGNGQNGQGQQAGGQNGQGQPVNGQSQQDEQEVVPYHVLSWQDDVVPTRRPPKREEL